MSDLWPFLAGIGVGVVLSIILLGAIAAVGIRVNQKNKNKEIL